MNRGRLRQLVRKQALLNFRSQYNRAATAPAPRCDPSGGYFPAAALAAPPRCAERFAPASYRAADSLAGPQQQTHRLGLSATAAASATPISFSV